MRAGFYRQQHRENTGALLLGLCLLTCCSFEKRLQGRCKPNAIELARIAEVQPVLANRLQRYDFFRKVVTYIASIFSIV